MPNACSPFKQFGQYKPASLLTWLSALPPLSLFPLGSRVPEHRECRISIRGNRNYRMAGYLVSIWVLGSGTLKVDPFSLQPPPPQIVDPILAAFVVQASHQSLSSSNGGFERRLIMQG